MTQKSGDKYKEVKKDELCIVCTELVFVGVVSVCLNETTKHDAMLGAYEEMTVSGSIVINFLCETFSAFFFVC